MKPKSKFAEAFPSLVLIAIALGYLVVSFEYDSRTRAMPLGVAALAIVLVTIDLLSHGDGSLARNLRRFLQGSGRPAPVPGLDGQAGQQHPPVRELAAFAWILGFLGLVLLAGFYVAIPIYVASYLYFHAGKRGMRALGTAVALTVLLYTMFEVLLGYEVFGGLISGDFM